MAAAHYHEQQSGSLCALHSSNNLLGRPQFTVDDFLTIKDDLGIPDVVGRCRCITSLPQCCCRRCRQDEGNFDANVITVALAQHNIELHFWDTRNKDPAAILRAMRGKHCVGALVNTQSSYHNCITASAIRCLGICFGKNGHWVAVKLQNNQLVDLNSQLKSPKIYQEEAEIISYIDKHLNRGSHILLASRGTDDHNE